MGYD
jgi:acyl-CoA dehydrogenase